MNRKLIAILALVIVAVGGWILFKHFWQNDFPYAGTLEATRIELPSRVATVVDSIAVTEGQPVKKGDVLATLACEDLLLASQYANENYDRSVRLNKAGATSKEAFDQAQNRKREADTKLSWCSIQSPVDGTVLDRYLEPKEWANPGTKILAVADLRHLWAFIYVPMEEMSRLHVGDTLEGLIPELENRSFKGVIEKVNEEAEFTPKNVQTRSERTRLVYGIKTAFENSDGALKPGMTIEIKLKE